MNFLAVLVASVFLSSRASANGRCREPYQEFNGRCYAVFQTDSTGARSIGDCYRTGGSYNRASVHNTFVNSMLAKLARNVPQGCVWIGLTNAVMNNESIGFLWDDGKSLIDGYQNWAGGEPGTGTNVFLSGGNRVFGKWYTESYEVCGVACEIPISSPMPSDEPYTRRPDFTENPKYNFTDYPNFNFTEHPNYNFTDYPNFNFTEHPNYNFTDYPNFNFTGHPSYNFTDYMNLNFNEHPNYNFTDYPNFNSTEQPYTRTMPLISTSQTVRPPSDENTTAWYPTRCPSEQYYGSGKIYSPNYPNSYPNDVSCKYVLNAGSYGTKVVIRFDKIDTEQDEDVILVFDGPINDHPKIFSGRHGAGELSFMSSARFVTVIFASDPSISGSGWSATFFTIS